MFYEYALEPAVLSNWASVRYFLDAFGPWKGRFLAEYPREWKKMVYNALDAAGCPNVEKSRIEVRLRQIDKRTLVLRPDALWDGTKSWVENALAEHEREPFRAIIARVAQAGRPHVLNAADVDEREALWRADQGGLVVRDPASIVRAIALLLAKSSRVLLIDPYFRADQGDKLLALRAICRPLAPRGIPLELHFADEARGYEPCIRDARRALPDELPSGMHVTMHCWIERAGGARLHNRFLLTDVGGVQFGDSVERGERGHEDRLSILEEATRVTLWEQYVGPRHAFDAAGAPVEFVGR